MSGPLELVGALNALAGTTGLDAAGAANAIPAALSGTYARSLKWFNCLDYGAKFDGITDDRAAIQAAVNAAVFSIVVTGKGAVVSMPPGVAYFGSGATIAATATDQAFSSQGVLLPVNLGATLVIAGSGRGVTTIKLSSSCWTAFSINKTADYQTFRNVTTRDFDVDGDNVTGRAHVLIGNIPSGVTRQVRLNFADLRHENHRIYNVPVEYAVPTTTTQKFGVAYIGQHPNAQQDGTPGTALSMEATQTSSKRVTCRDVRVEGAASGVAVCSWLNSAGYQGTGPTNHFYDAISFERCQHVVGSVGTARTDQTSFFIGGAGIGEYGEIIDCYSSSIGDDAIEVGGMQHCLIERFNATDPYQVGVLVRQSQPPRNVKAQKYVIKESVVRVTSALSGKSDANSMPVGVICDNGVSIGTIETERLAYETTGQVFSAMNALHARAHLFAEMTAAVQRWVHVSPRISIDGLTYDAASGTDVSLFFISPAAPATVTIRDVDVRIGGFTQTGAGGLAFALVQVEGTGPRVGIDGVDSDLSGVAFSATGGSASLLNVAKNTSANIRVVARGLRPSASPSAVGGSASKWGARIYGAGSGIDQVVIADSHFGSASGLTGDVDFANAGTNRNRVRQRNNVTLTTSNGIVSVSANYTAGTADEVIFATGGASGITITLPTAKAERVTIVKIDSGAGAVTVAPSGTTINGNSTYALTAQYQMVSVADNGTFWYIVGKNP